MTGLVIDSHFVSPVVPKPDRRKHSEYLKSENPVAKIRKGMIGASRPEEYGGLK
jgi:hypothetical protein